MSYIGKFQRVITNVGPWFLRQKNIGTFLESVGLLLDGAADGMLAGMRLGYPLRCPANQLPTIAYDRGIRLYPSEPEASKRERPRQWWWLHKRRGSHQGEMRHVQPYFLPGALPTIRIVHQSGGVSPRATWHTLNPLGQYSAEKVSPSNFNIDDRPSLWGRWAAFIDMSETDYTAPEVYGGGGTYGGGWVYGAGGANPLPAQARADLAAMFLDWKAAHSWLNYVVLVWPGPAAFPSFATVPTQDADGWWNLPSGAGTWADVINPVTHLNTRPPNFDFIYDNPAP